MGLVRMGIPTDIARFIKENFNINTFVETGTYKGETAIWASSLFDKVFTIEYSKQFYNETKSKYIKAKNIEFIFGDSRQELQKLLPNIGQSIIWLDAHWCSLGSYGETDQCPLLKELELINKYEKDHFILIDDARFFITPPPLPHSLDFFPDISTIIKTITSKREQYIIIYEDVIIIVPKLAKEKFMNYMQTITTNDHIEYDKLMEEKKREQERLEKRIKLKRQFTIFLKKLIKK